MNEPWLTNDPLLKWKLILNLCSCYKDANIELSLHEYFSRLVIHREGVRWMEEHELWALGLVSSPSEPVLLWGQNELIFLISELISTVKYKWYL